MGYSHSHSALAECLLTSTIQSRAEMRIPYGTKIYTEVIDEQELSFTLRKYFRRQLLQELCLGFPPDIRWDRLPDGIRKYLVNRCLCQSNPPSESQRKYLASALCESSGLELDVYIARCDFAAFMAGLCYHRAAESPSKELMQDDSLQSSDKSFISADNLTVESSTLAKWPLSKIPRQLSSYIYHKIGTACKFFAVAFVADAEYQRELDCVLSDCPVIIAKVTIFFLCSIWIFCKSIQRLLLPIFLVS